MVSTLGQQSNLATVLTRRKSSSATSRTASRSPSTPPMREEFGLTKEALEEAQAPLEAAAQSSNATELGAASSPAHTYSTVESPAVDEIVSIASTAVWAPGEAAVPPPPPAFNAMPPRMVMGGSGIFQPSCASVSPPPPPPGLPVAPPSPPPGLPPIAGQRRTMQAPGAPAAQDRVQQAPLHSTSPLLDWMSAGSMGHPHSCAGPCRYIKRKGGCRDGANCAACHVCFWRRGGKKELIFAARPGAVEFDAVEKLMSAGTRGHPVNCGPSCKHVRRKGGCRDGAACPNCHMCLWRREKEAAMDADTERTEPSTDLLGDPSTTLQGLIEELLSKRPESRANGAAMQTQKQGLAAGGDGELGKVMEK